MKRILSIFAAVFALWACQPEVQPGPDNKPDEKPDNPDKPDPELPVDDIYLNVATRVKSVTDPGATVDIMVECNDTWDFSLSEESFVEQSRTETSLTLALDKLCYERDRDIVVKVFATRAPEKYQDVTVKVRCALSLDIAFNDDGSAKDLSPNGIFVSRVDGVGSVVYHNADADRNVAKFFSSLGGTCSGGFYKVNYNGGKTLLNALSDGHSLEVQFMMAEENPGNNEVKMFSSMDAGGTGFLLPVASRGKDITFLPNCSESGSSNWRWCQSGVVPEVGKYYHVVGVWDKAAGKARVYVNGELKKEIDAVGEFVQPASPAARWFCVGGDSCSSDYAESAWNGDVVIARVYDATLRDSDVRELWDKANVDFKANAFEIKKLLYLPYCAVSAGADFVIAGEGFKVGDKVRFENGSYSAECNVTLESGRVRLSLPEGITTGDYKMTALRGVETAPLGMVHFEVSAEAPALVPSKVVAHRCFHKNHPENSIAAYKAAKEAGFYGAEIDVWMTTDKQLFVNHDGVVNGVRIQDNESSKITGASRFEEFVDEALKGGTKLVVEVKEHSTAQRNRECTELILKVLREKGYKDADFISFNLDICKQIAAAEPEATVAYLSSTTDLQGLKNGGISCIDFTYTYLFQKPELFQTAHSLGMKVNIWTVNSGFDLAKCIGLGADYITTDSPDELQTIIDRLF